MANVPGECNLPQNELGTSKQSHKYNAQNTSRRIKRDLENALEKYLKIRNYNYKVEDGKIVIPNEDCIELSSNESSTINKLTTSNNSIVYSYVNIDIQMLDIVDQEFSRLQHFIYNLKNSTVKEELQSVIPVLLCHLYLEILKGVDKPTALAFLDKHSPMFLQSEPATEGHYELLSQLRAIVTIQDIANQPLLALFRSSKHITSISSETSTVLRNFLSKHGHSIIIHILNKWFHYEIKQAEKISFVTENVSKCKEIDAHMNNVIKDSSHENISDNLKELVSNIKKISLARVTNLLNADRVTCATSDSYTFAKAVGLSNSEIVIVQNNLDFIELEQNFSDDRLEVQYLQGHGNAVTDLKFNQKGSILLSTSRDETIRLWSVNNRKCLNIYSGHQYPIWALDIAPNEQYFATGSFDRTARLWCLERKHPIRIFIGHSQSVQAVAFHKNGKYIATGSQDSTVRLYSITDAGVLRLMNEPTSPVYSVAFSLDGKFLAGACEDGIVYIWDLAKGSCLYKLSGHSGAINSIVWDKNADSDKLYTTTVNGEVKMWSRQNDLWQFQNLHGDGIYKRILKVELLPLHSGPHIFAIPY